MKKNIIKIKDFLIRKLNKGGTLFLTEHISKIKKTKEILKEWSNRNDIFYLNLFKKLNLKKVDEYKYLHNFTSIYVGKNSTISKLQNQTKYIKFKFLILKIIYFKFYE